MGRSNIPGAVGGFSNAPNFNFNDGEVKFDTNRMDNVNDNFGSASGFLAKSLLIMPKHSPLGGCFPFILDCSSNALLWI